MIRITTIILSIIACFLFALIATNPAWAVDNVETSATNKKPLAKPKPDKVLVYLLRIQPYRGLIYRHRSPWIFFDQTPIAVMRNKRYTYIYIDPGEHVIWTTRNIKINKLGAIRIKAKAGETYYLYFHDSYGLKSPLIWVRDHISFRKDIKLIKYIARSDLMTEAALEQANEIIEHNYDYAKETATNYPFTIVGSLPKPKRYRDRPGKIRFYTPSSDITTGEPTADKALVYVMTRDQIVFLLRRGKTSSHWTFVDDKLLAITWRGKYGYALVDPGEHIFWSVYLYALPPTFRNISTGNAIKMKVEAGKTYYLEHNIKSNLDYPTTITRVVNEKLGKKILESFKYISTPTKKALDWRNNVYKRYKGCSAPAATQYLQTSFSAVWVCETGSDGD